MYVLCKDHKGKTLSIRLGNSHIPLVQGNRDYRKYLAWCAEGNTPEVYTNPEPVLDAVDWQQLAVELQARVESLEAKLETS